MKKFRIGVLTGGGDCAGLNSALKWVVKTAMDERLEFERGVRYEVIGIRDGWKGLTNVDLSSPDTQGSIVHLNPDIVRTWDRYGGTMLGTSRQSPFDPQHDQTDLVIVPVFFHQFIDSLAGIDFCPGNVHFLIYFNGDSLPGFGGFFSRDNSYMRFGFGPDYIVN